VVESGLSLAVSMRIHDLFLPNVIASLEYNVPGSYEWMMEIAAETFEQVSKHTDIPFIRHHAQLFTALCLCAGLLQP
jgi:hypothetical protein